MTTMVSQDRSAPEAVRVWLLGGFRVSVGNRKVDESAWRLKKAASLVKLLAAKSQVARSDLRVGMECAAGDVEGLAQVVGGGS